MGEEFTLKDLTEQEERDDDMEAEDRIIDRREENARQTDKKTASAGLTGKEHNGMISDAEKLVKILQKKKLFITTVESCTGGAICSAIVDVAGASDVLKEAFVTYCDAAKQELAGVKKKTLKKYTAVSKQVARQMAKGGAKRAGADLCLAATGVAGPGGTPDFPAGLVYLGCFYQGKTKVKKFYFKGSRNEVRAQAVREALRMALEALKA